MFADSFRMRRCIVPADGFYEWRTVGKKKLPVRFQLKDRSPFAFAGIWDVWKGPGGSAFTFAILTTTSNELTRPIHDRMPVILAREDEEVWLDPNIQDAADAARLRPMLRPHVAAEMETVPANPWVNKAGNEGPECLTPPT